jgi:hypothetical protein
MNKLYSVPKPILKVLNTQENADELMDTLLKWLEKNYNMCHENGRLEALNEKAS